MIIIIETMPGFTSLVLRELELRNVAYRQLYSDQSTVIVDIPDEHVRTVRKLQVATCIERKLVEVDYVRDVKEFRKYLRQTLRELRDTIPEGSIVNMKFIELSQKVRRIILREVERVLKCKLTRSRGDYELSARFLNRKIVLCLNIATFQPMYRRWYTRFKSRSSINPVIAAAMSLIAGYHEHVVDPFAGSYTIPIEYYRMWRPKRITCIDIDKYTLLSSVDNIRCVEGLQDVIDVISCDYFKIDLRDLECIVTDPPRGLRLKTGMTFYRKMAEKFRRELKGGGIVVLPVFKNLKNFLVSLFRRNNFAVSMPVWTIQGGLKTYILRAEKL